MLDEDCAELHVLISSDEQLRELNRQYRGIDAPTDVLSFVDGERLPSGLRLLGELAISLDTARRQAAEQGHDELRELSELVVHGTMHLLGYDHECDDGQMNELELRIRQEILR
jgi:probable rRNA maturation factor